MKKTVLILVSLFILSFGLTACGNGGMTKKSGYFKYKINNETGEVMLIGLTKEGQKQETLVIPTMIKGRMVTTIGYIRSTYPDGGAYQCDFESENLKNIYFPSTIINTELSYGFYRYLPNVEKVFWGAKWFSNSLLDFGNNSRNINVFITYESYQYNKFYEDKYASAGNTLIDYSYIKSANVVYYLNNENDETFFVDDVSGTPVNVIPPDPIREGYNFTGWYKEEGCINKWDFENDIVPLKEYDENNNYNFKGTRIYAGWENK